MPKKPTIPTLDDVAKAAGVSTATVSRCLNSPDVVVKATKDRVLKEVARLGYTPNFGARAMVARRTFTIGAIIPTMENAIFARGLQAFQEQLHERGYTLLVSSSSYRPEIEEEQLRSLVARGADGILLIGYARDASIYDYLASRNMPVLVAWAYEADNPLPSIGFDNRASMRALGELVWDHGHRRIGVISGVTQGNDRAQRRVEGLMDAFLAKGLPAENLKVIEVPYGIKEGGEAFARLMAADVPPTVVMCGNDVLAAGAVQRARLMKIRIPEGVSITGFDDIELARIVSPALTTVHVPHRKMGRASANALIDMVESGISGPFAPLESKIKIRGSLGRLSGP
ncbi:LacI family DNA-binding transcriptional regulator [Sulfitobacter sp. M57]|uniref:LacI family DNA-binding transcriptional regulator n=1 Tax=unclassified Sulfitobacter TaxID=196795 RepID=UPI0023E1959A|nr:MULTISPECIES: LacI family DNA-binding transcriptional regulator [unclassified Sulfitobacter]MDF3413019.1 LacI family DNA-binding transcriptional regulator [Sulfitobacter sp. KE5]MDF3421697.1 LacI family DNA-binding transcriptional regulator [Sulfitobacter sp. KE43]MDF3431568.1 LacI family DNA-binding transcriptional regulator [Sulfitobacter sp. KE42]MDF3457209.1 LacI family DNA-binding transcriptional regulator [Sulfitobacter sp. S74]MDF3461112.1 LacI family DNA-binding transcriptional regu